MTQTTCIRARYEESDQMGFIHHSNHIVWFELARMNYFREIGISLRDMEKENLIFPVLTVEAKYISPAFFDDDILVHSAVVEKTSVRLKFHYRISRQDGCLLCAGVSTHAFIRKDNHQPLRIPQTVYDRIELSEDAKNWWKGARK